MGAPQPRLIIRKPKVYYRTAVNEAAGTDTWVDVSGYFRSVEIMPKREKIPTPGYGTVGYRNDKGDPTHQIKLVAYHSRAWTDFSSLMVAELNSDDPTGFMVKYRGEVATSTDNPYRKVAVMMIDLGSLGGQQNTPSSLDITLDIEGQILKSTTAGDPPAIGTFSVEM